MTALLIALSTVVVCLSVALWRSRQTVRRQTCEIGALQMTNYELSGQAAELATLAHEAQAQAHGDRGAMELTERLMQQAESMLHAEIDAHRATKRKLATTRAWVTRLRK